MKILCVFSKYPAGSVNTNITKDLALALKKAGNEVSIVTILERKYKKRTHVDIEDSMDVLRVKTGNMFNEVSKYEKFITTLLLPYQIYNAVINKFSEKYFDLIITHTPFISDARLISKLKKKYNARALLLLWDIFPQNALDIGILKKGLLFDFLKKKECRMLKTYEFINCMSNGNRDYLLKHYTFITPASLIVNYNWGVVIPSSMNSKQEIRDKFGFDMQDKLCVFGGNVGLPQCIDNIFELIKCTSSEENVKFLVVGAGTEVNKLQYAVAAHELVNVFFYEHMQRAMYEELISCCDLGLVSLDPRFTVPNFPSKTTDYFKCSLPVFAMLDRVAYQDYGSFLTIQAKAGVAALADDAPNASSLLISMLNNTDALHEMGMNARCFFELYLNVDEVVKNILTTTAL
jgi:hypothetical protein